jgi:hypothetical protein
LRGTSTGCSPDDLSIELRQEGSMRSSWRTALVRLASAAVVAGGGLLSGCGPADAIKTGLSVDTSVEMIAGSQGSSFSLSLECGAAQEARRLGVTLTVVAPASFTAADQEALVNGVIGRNPDALIIDPASTTALNSTGRPTPPTAPRPPSAWWHATSRRIRAWPAC